MLHAQYLSHPHFSVSRTDVLHSPSHLSVCNGDRSASPESTMVDFDLLLAPSEHPSSSSGFPYPSLDFEQGSAPSNSLALPKAFSSSTPSSPPPATPLSGLISAAKPPLVPVKATTVTPKTRSEIRRARAARNRSSARRSRLRKKEENKRDMEIADEVRRTNESLRSKVATLREKIVSLHKVSLSLGLDVQGMPQYVQQIEKCPFPPPPVELPSFDP